MEIICIEITFSYFLLFHLEQFTFQVFTYLQTMCTVTARALMKTCKMHKGVNIIGVYLNRFT